MAQLSLRKSEVGMTLIELVVVALLMSVLSAILYGTINGIARARESTEHIGTIDQAAHQVLGRMMSELASRSFVPLNTQQGIDPTAAGGIASIGNASVYLLGTDKKNGENDADEIRFVSSSAAQPLIGAPSNHGLLEVKYRLAEDPDRPKSDAEAKVLSLVREEEPAAVTAKDLGKKRRIVLPIADNVVSLNFRYLKKGAWQNEWKESTPPLPEAIEITLQLMSPDGKKEWYRTAVPISSKQ